MRRVVCEECRKLYDYDKDEFCPRCGAFNQPSKASGGPKSTIRKDGVNERDHAGSFVHSEVHKEKRVRQAKGLDRRPAARGGAKQKNESFPKVIFWIIVTVIVLNLLFPLLGMLFRI